MRYGQVTVILLLITLATPVHATVTISEIAWMGTTESHLCNWLELHNSGDEPVDVADWTLYIDDTARPLADGDLERGSGTVIEPGAYWLIERYTDTCPDPVPGISDWYLAFGNLLNTGVTLRLERGDGSEVDSVVGGDDWENVGGDNTTKATAQWTEAGWITAPPTPGAPPPEPSDDSATGTVAGASTTAEPTTSRGSQTILFGSDEPSQPLAIADMALALSIEAHTYAYAGQPLTLQAEATGLLEVLLDSLQYQWNLGDLQTAVGPEVTHTYVHPGTYVVTVWAGYQDYEQIARHEVTVLPVNLALSRTTNGDVQLYNTTPYEIDISGYRIQGARAITVPDRTRLLPQSIITIPASEVDTGPPSLVMAYDRQGELVASTYHEWHQVAADEETEATVATATTGSSAVSTTNTPTAATAPPGLVTGIATSAPATPSSPATATPTPQAVGESTVLENDSTTPSGPPWWSYVALVLLLLLAGATLLPRTTRAPASRGSEN